MTYSVYIDILFFVNFMINTVILMASAALMKIKYSPARILLGAALGAVYACVIFFPKLGFLYTLGARAAVAAAICTAAFAPKSVRQCVKQAAVFYATTAVFGLVTLALLYFTDIGIKLGGVISNGVFYFNIPLRFLLVSCALSYAAITLVQRFLKKSGVRSFAPVTLVVGTKSVELNALIDTGNLLKDPLSGKSVMIAEASSVAPLFDFDIANLADAGDVSHLPAGFRLVPFSSVGRKNGILTAFVPDRVIIENSEHTDIITAICKDALSASRDYDALLSPEALIRGDYK